MMGTSLEQSETQAAIRLDDAEHILPPADAPALLETELVTVEGDDASAGDWLGTTSGTLNAIERLKATIDEETDKLEVRAPVDFDSFSQRKNRGLLELTRAMRMAQETVDPRVTPHLTSLRASLIRNQAALQIHLDAVREVSAIITKSIQEVESDGTYSLSVLGTSK